MATTISTQDLIEVKRDIDDIGKAVNEKVIVSPRYGEDFKSLPMIVEEFQDAINTIVVDDGVPAVAVSDSSGKTQQEINNIVKTISLQSTSDLLAITNPINNQFAFISNTKSVFAYDNNKASENDGSTVINGWVLQNTKEVNLKDFPRIAGETDDTGRFQRASAKMQRTYATTTIGIEAQAATLLTIPYGNYVISDEVRFVRNTYIVGEGKVNITQNNPTKSSIVIDDFINVYIKNIRIIGGVNSIQLINLNIGGSDYTLENCEFYSSSSYAVYTTGLTASKHLSCLGRIVGCKFMFVNKILHNASDWCLLDSCWLVIDKSNFEADTAAIYNFNGRLIVKDCLGNPTMGVGANRLNNVRWIDQHAEFGGVVCIDTRFGGEQNGIPIIYSYTPLQYSSQQGPSVIVERCQVSTGIDHSEGLDQVGIVKICSGFPRQLIIKDNFYHGFSAALIVDSSYDLPAYLSTLPVVTLNQKLDIVIKNNSRWYTDANTPVNGIRPEYPEYLSFWVNRGYIDEYLAVPKVTLKVTTNKGGVDYHLTKYPIKFGSLTTSHLVNVSYIIGEPTTSKIARTRSFILNIGTANRTSDNVLVNYITFNEIGVYEIPSGLDADTVTVDAGFEGGVAALPKTRTQKATMLGNEILIVVKGVKSASVTITPLGVS